MRSILLRVAFALLLLSLPGAFCRAQIEHLPVGNPIYDFLDRMAVRGLLPDFSRSHLPYQRIEVARFLDTLSARPQALGETERALLARYRDEVNAELDNTQTQTNLFEAGPVGEKIDGIFSDRQKNLYHWRDSSTTFYVEFLGSADYRTLISSAAKSNVTLGQVGGRFRGTVKGFLGYSLQATNGTDFGSKDLALADRTLRQNAKFADFGDAFFDFAEAYLSADFGWGNVTLGRERFYLGQGIRTRFIVSDNAPTFDAIRFEAHIGTLRYQFAHSAILDRKQRLEDGQAYYDPKFMATHRGEATLFDAVRFGVYESVIYAKRFVDLAYFNPINFYKSAEHALGDRDNPFLGFDLQTVSIPGVQLYGGWLIDDIDFHKMGTGWWGNKFAWQAGAMTSLFLPNTDGAIEYIRVEPYTFSHFYPENNYTHKGAIIGSEILPNSDAWLFRLRHWIGSRTIVTLSLQMDRHGANVTAPDGTLIRNVGGDPAFGLAYGRDSETVRFLDGVLSKQQTVTLEARWEPWRNIVFDLLYRWRHQSAPAADPAADHFLSLLLDLQF